MRRGFVGGAPPIFKKRGAGGGARSPQPNNGRAAPAWPPPFRGGAPSPGSEGRGLARSQRPLLPTAGGPPRIVAGRRVLIVDETCDSGDTMKLALNAVRELKPAAVKTAVSFRTGPYQPDFYALETDNFIILPWDREVIIDGAIVVRPDYAEKLKELGG